MDDMQTSINDGESGTEDVGKAGDCCCCGQDKTTQRTEDEKKKLLNRLKRIEGQVRGLQP